MKKFNITGTCIPEKHYMVDISSKLDEITKLIENDEYFTVNKSRQYGKTTTLAALYRRLKDEYVVIRMSFEGLSEVSFSSSLAFVKMFIEQLKDFWEYVDQPQQLMDDWTDEAVLDNNPEKDPLDCLSKKITRLCKQCDKDIILMIDEVDKSSDNQIFLNFLGMLRNKYLKRSENLDYTFKSVILAGVYDIKNLKLKIRNDEEKKYNSPWNIAADFKVDMSFSPKEISSMLIDYENDNHIGMDIMAVSEELYFYTSGYPFLVSRLCKWIDEDGNKDWTKAGVRNAEKELLKCRNTLFDDLIKNVENNKDLNQIITTILYDGYTQGFNLSDPAIEKGAMLGILSEKDHKVAVSNVIFETYLYDYLVSVNSRKNGIVGEDRNQFVNNGKLNIQRVLTKFQELMKSEYRSEDDKFLEQQGRLLFLCFLKPIINGTGHYYVEPETRNNTRMDIVIAYGEEEYIIELKIWRGEEYRKQGICQLEHYMDNRNAKTGYLLSFSFLKNKEYKARWLDKKESSKSVFEVVV
jgi:phosphoenolpyruvate synthase/pyruvate phosphate dikinase